MYGGSLVVINTELTWVMLIMCRIDDSRAKLCTGSAIHPRWVLTAAHCVVNEGSLMSVSRITVHSYLAINRYSKVEVHSVFVHPRYLFKDTSDDDSTGDIALIKSQYVMDVGMAKVNADPTYYPSGTCRIAGFGRKGLLDERSPTLHTMTVRTFPQAGCSKITSSAICLLQFKGVGPCVGDSGSPIICDGRIAGVLSSGRIQGIPICGSISTNGILFYEPVADYLSWISGIQTTYGRAAVSPTPTSIVFVSILLAWLQ